MTPGSATPAASTTPRSGAAFARLLLRLRDAPPAATWPADRTMPQPPPEARSTLAFEVPGEIADGLADVAREAGVPALATLAAGLQALLYRVASPWENTAVEEVIVGAGRADSWLPLRQAVDPYTSFADLAARAATELRDLAGAELAAGAPTDPAWEEVCRAAVLLVPAGQECGELLMDLVFAFDLENGCRGSLTYDGLRYSSACAERIAASYLEVLRAATSDLKTPIGLLALVPRTVRGSAVAADRIRDVPGPGPVESEAGEWNITAHELFDRAAARRPDAPALRWHDGGSTYAELTYEQLQAAADRWAARIGTARAVALSGPRGPELIVALLAILKSGAGYVPLDPTYPRERLGYMLADSRAEVLIRPAAADGEFAVPDGVRVVDLDDILADPPGDNTPERPFTPAVAAPTDLCYVIYTSGSTGVPKGVAMPHRPLASLLDWQFRHSAAGPAWTTLQFAAFSFDVAFQEMFSTWGSGGTLLLIADEVRRDPDQLAGYLIDQEVHRLFVPFVALQQLAEACLRCRRYPVALREVITAGEQLHVSPAVREFFRRTGASLENQYGPTETHVVTAERLSGDPEQWPGLPAIGRPIDRAVVEILDERLQPLPDGVPGEICVSGMPLADGYIGKADVTAERFVNRAGGRTYRTGDYGTRFADGRIQYLGRRDGQVKIRGYRVELGEIEARVKARAGLAEAIVVVQEAPSEKRIIAYYLPVAGYDIPPRTLRGDLARILPAPMVPFACVAVAGLPLTPSGKVDRRALAGRPLPEDLDAAYEAVLDALGASDAVEAASPDDVASPVEAESSALFEKLLVEVWADALARDTIAVQADLFALGAESVTALEVAAQLTDILCVVVPVRVLFDRRTVAAQAGWLAARDAADGGRPAEIARLLLAADADDLITT